MVADRHGSLWLIIVETVVVAVEVLLQKLWMFRLPALQQIGLDGSYSDSDKCTKVCIITGPTSGIGKESAKEMWRRGWHVVLACRNEAKGKELAKEFHSNILKTKQAEKNIEVQVLDVSSLKSVRAFAMRWETEVKLPVHVLINNAGIFSMSAPRQETEDGFESHIGTNYLGHFLLAELMRPWMIKAQRECHKPARIVNVSSKLHRMGRICQGDPHLTSNKNFNSLAAYSQSKLAQVMFAKECNKKFDGVIRSISVHPGEVLTDVVRSLPSIIQKLYKLIMQIFLLTPSEGAAVVCDFCS
jgi:retinol dehydrogenase-12